MNKNFVNQLNQKEAKAFKELIKLYEQKEYKKGLRQAESLLKSIPDNPETLSMKGIFLFLTGSQEEGITVAKSALSKNSKSEICWHIYGIINRSQRQYALAIKCYKQALSFSPDNAQILRDLALLQVQIRDIDGLLETRQILLQQKEGLIINWVSYAVASYLKRDFNLTIKVLASVSKLVKENPLKKFEKSELHLFEGLVYIESEQYQKGIDFLTKNENEICDKVGLYEQLAKCYIKSGNHQKAIKPIQELLKINQDNQQYFVLMHEALQTPLEPKTEEEKEKTFLCLEDLVNQYPKSQIIKNYQLRFANGANFQKKLAEYIKPYFQKGLPSLFQEIKFLYEDQQKVPIIELVLLENMTSLEQKQTFVDSNEKQTPCCLLWNYMLLAQHYDRIKKWQEALDYIEKAITHTPTLIELYTFKSKIFKHLYSFNKASYWAEKARSLDLADRFLNNRAIKYALRDDQIENSEKLIKMFLRDPNDGNAFDLQTMWYEVSLGYSYLRLKNFGPAFRMFKFIEKHFNDMYEDQFDFHTYCMRKYSLRSYVNMIKYEDDVTNNKFFILAAVAMIRTMQDYVFIREQDKVKEEEEKERVKNMSQSERKKYKKQKEKEEEERAKDPSQELRKKLDLDGKEYLEKLKDPVEEANNFAKKLIEINIQNSKLAFFAETNLIDFYIKSKKILLALKALHKLIKTKYCLVEIHFYIIKVVKFIQDNINLITESISKEIILEEIKNLTNGQSLDQFQNEFFQNQKGNLKACVLNAETNKLLHNQSEEQTISQIEGYLQDIKGVTLQDTIYAYNFLKIKVNHKVKQEIRNVLRLRFPLCDYFLEVLDDNYEPKQKEEVKVDDPNNEEEKKI